MSGLPRRPCPSIRPGDRPAVRLGAALAVGLVLAGAGPAGAAGPLGPQDLLLVFNASEADSRSLAEYYATARGVPAERLCGLELGPARDDIARPHFERRILVPIREFIESRGLRDQVRCLVTFYGVPIRAGAVVLTPAQRMARAETRRRIEDGLRQLREATAELDGLATGTRPADAPATAPATAESPESFGPEDFPALLNAYAQARRRLGERTGGQFDAQTESGQLRTLVVLTQRVEGVAGVLRMFLPSGAAAEAMLARNRQAAEALLAADVRIREIMPRGPEDERHAEALDLLLKFHGLIGWLKGLLADETWFRTEETEAAVDSELALLWWGEYPRYRWIPNPLRGRASGETAPAEGSEDRPEPLMTARLDASRPEVVRAMIDRALEAERRPSSGHVYIDARGLAPGPGYGTYDQNLRDLARLLQDHTRLPVRLDDRPEVFPPGSCPDALLYCGWYSLREYVPALTFVPGAVGYHIASLEAVSLRRPGERGWCRNLLEDGITATLGPVAEPYLDSFPLPTEFFGLLLTGRYPLAECYARSVPSWSWMQMLLGDPLFNPFARRPVLPDLSPTGTTTSTAPAG